MLFRNKNIILFDQVDSTNNYAKQLVSKKVDEGTVVLAHFQSKGRGQQGNFWESEAEKNLLFSLILYPEFLEAGKQFYISMIVSLALVELLQSEVSEVTIKWPNDIYVAEKKIAGMLIENSISGTKLDSTVAGIGLNLNQEEFTSNAPNPVSLKQITEKEYEREYVLTRFLAIFSGLYEKLKQGNFEQINNAYCSQLFRNKGWHVFRKDQTEFNAKIVGIGEYGQLQLEKRSGEITEYIFKEIEFVL